MFVYIICDDQRYARLPFNCIINKFELNCIKTIIDPKEISDNELSFIEKCANKQPPKFIKIKDAALDGCKYCDNLISLEYDIGCLEKSMKHWSYKLSKESDKCSGYYWHSSFEVLIWRIQQLSYIKKELTKLKGIYNLDCYIKSSSYQ